MNRARAGTRGSARPVFLLAATLLAAACGSAVESPRPSDEAILTPLPSGALATPATSATPVAATSDNPASPAITASPSASPTPSPVPSGRDAAAGACSGSSDTRDFFTAIAEAVDWDVYCAVLPGGWFIDSGTYHLGKGGRMAITYRSQAGARLELHEGAWCTDSGSGCVGPGSDGGSATFGREAGTLTILDGGGFALSVDRGSMVSWVATGTGLDEATFRSLCSELALVKA